MCKKNLLVLSVVLLMFTFNGFAQNTRISDHNEVGWYGFSGTFKLSEKWGMVSEYQWRRNHIITDWQQSLSRISGSYQIQPRLQFRVGYAWAKTFAYGDLPINRYGKSYNEHRAFEMVTLTDKLGIVSLSHRFMLEQRWIGRYTSGDLDKEDQFPFRNRFRYMFRLQMPLKGQWVVDKTPYLVFFNELMVNFGKNVPENVFDQNRLGLLFGYRVNSNFSLEAGYISQILQFGREIDGNNVFQYNNGVMVNTLFSFDLSKKSDKVVE
ncbi:MAG: long-chain fatty acid transporter [Flavobacterium sp. BFFFF1]|uniref:DUF2490 domain-containing protein n=1 Tax=Flavobacterium sp. BFFFF1 TaxID=2015557 RepID=UPI000BC3BC9A|nr:DUF2490 domain-containing protein [Flavobacterium sp. BFFFF1]OYU82052.1 MAG: long-chain fatty acid transporter [Flavobacterium sp. BFFFF1]